MPSRHRPCLLSPNSDVNIIHRQGPLPRAHPTRIRPSKHSAQTARTPSISSRRELGEGTPKPIKFVSTATEFAATTGTHSAHSCTTPTPHPPAPPPPPPPPPPLPRPTIQALESDLISQVAVPVQSAGARSFQQRQRRRHRHAPATYSNVNKLSPGILDHHIFTKGEWQRTRLRDHPKVSITISVDTPAKARNSRSADASNTYEEVSAIADTGTQSDSWSLADFLNLWILTRRPLSRQP